MGEGYRRDPFPEVQGPSPKEILKETEPSQPLSLAAAEIRLAEVLAHIIEISRKIEDKNKKRGRPWASDPQGSWRKAAMLAREELRIEERSLRSFMEQCHSSVNRAVREQRVTADLYRQEIDKSTRQARKLSKKEHQEPLWELYLKAEVTFLSILASGGFIGPLGESLLYLAEKVVPGWYREHWLRSVYGTTWGRQAEALKARHDNE